jgi:hypothetical protein
LATGQFTFSEVYDSAIYRFYLAPLVLGHPCARLRSVAARRCLGGDKCGSFDRVMVALRVTEALYPELKGREFSLQFSEGTGGLPSGPADVRNFSIVVDKPQWHPPETNGQRDVTPQSRIGEVELPLHFHFGFIDYDSVQRNSGRDLGADLGRDLVCRPIEFRNDKTSSQMEQARAKINAHPEWTDDQDIEAARQQGLRFGPDNKAAVLKLIPLQSLGEFYGPLQIKKARFSVAGNSMKEPHSSFADLRWYIDAEEVGTLRVLQITVEPFGGKIDSISEGRNQR